jgi:hypothetical protein
MKEDELSGVTMEPTRLSPEMLLRDSTRLLP